MLAWLLLAGFLSALLMLGISPNGDGDDLLKMQEIRHAMTGPSLFDRTIPGVSQPEPMISHWPWIADAPYALVAWPLQHVLGLETALQAAAFVVPLLLLGTALTVLYRTFDALDFSWPGAILIVAAFVSLTSLAEFQPGRIDYHNIQMLLLCVVVLATIRGGARCAAVCGGAMALSFAISSEIAPFLMVPMGWFTLRMLSNQKAAAQEVRAFGLALGIGALIAFLGVTLPQGGDFTACDRYAAPHLLALGGAGLTFLLAGSLPASGALRVGVIAIGGAISAAALLVIFPNCLDGPYGALSPYLRETWLQNIEQEMSLFAAPDALSGGRFGKLALAFLGAGAVVMRACRDRGAERAWLVLAVYCAIGLVLSLFYVRYLRFLPLLATPGFVLILRAALPADFSTQKWLGLKGPGMAIPAWLLAAPAIALIGLVLAVRAITPPQDAPLTGIDVASACSSTKFDDLIWPSGSRVMAPPAIAVAMLGRPGTPLVVAVPFHTVGPGVERTYRFFDPATSDPERWLAESQATNVAVCRIDGDLPAKIMTDFPHAAGLAVGRPPEWLTECPPKGSGLRVYRHAGSPIETCPQ